MTSQVPRRALAWAGEALGLNSVDEIVSATPMLGGITSEMALLTTPGGADYVLRRMIVQPWVAHAGVMLRREAGVQRLLAGGPVPVPALVAVDPSGERAGEPCLLMTRQPGEVMLDRSDDAVLAETARVLVEVHTTPVTEANRPRTYQNWAGEGPWDVPGWAHDAAVWQRAFAVMDTGPPPFEGVFLHRDYNPGNLLWSGTDGLNPRVSGVVDWVETSWGPADLDVAHCGKYLAILHGPAVAQRFVREYLAAGGALAHDADARRYWMVMVALATRGPERGMAQWRAQGLTSVGLDEHRARLESHLAAVLSA